MRCKNFWRFNIAEKEQFSARNTIVFAVKIWYIIVSTKYERNIFMIETRIYDSLVPVYADREPVGKVKNSFFMCENQPVSFQMAFKMTDGSAKNCDFHIKTTSDLPISIYYINNVPLLHTSTIDTGMQTGLYPDILVPKKTNPPLLVHQYFGNDLVTEQGEKVRLRAYDDSWQAVWFTVNEDAKTVCAGVHKLKFELFDRNGNPCGDAEAQIEVLPVKLGAQKLMYTNWFHNDCLADVYNVEVFTDKYFEIFETYVKTATKNGMNMILMPAFTPPLDTSPGGERMTVQLVKITKKGKKYTFDFSLMKKFVDVCRKNGIKYFEHSHLFTQWGAKAAPKIEAYVNGRKKKIFGWETDSGSQEYADFLTQYITELKKFLKAEKLEKKILFHVSDEPQNEHIPHYSVAFNAVAELLKDYMMGDALSHFEIYEKGICRNPIVMTADIKPFLGKVKNLWAYYVGSAATMGASSNRTFHIPRERNRMLGVQLFYHDIKGFLHWGYNNYYGELSQYLFDPILNPCGGFSLAGTSFFVYPAFNGGCYQSVRQKIFSEGLVDMRLLELLKKLVGKEACNALIEKHFGVPSFDVSPRDAQSFAEFIDEVYETIKKNV